MIRWVILFMVLGIVHTGLCQQVLTIKSDPQKYAIKPAPKDSISKPESRERKVALVIGNKNYKSSPLLNSENDAADLTELLTGKGFEVTKITDGTRLEMRDAVKSFSSKIAQGGIGLFYYSGHGIQMEGENYLVPIDANFEYQEEVRDMCVSVSSVLSYMQASNNRLNIMILDACRNSPFRSFSRSGEAGMVRVEPPTGAIVAYSTAPGRTASDGNGRNGMYTAKLMKYMNVPGLSIEDIFKQVRIEVSRESQNRQVPWEQSSLTGDFYFTPN